MKAGCYMPLRLAVAGRGECAVGDSSNQTYREAAADSRLFERMPRGVSAVRGPVDHVGGLEHQPRGRFGGILGRSPGAFSPRVQLWRTRSEAQKALSYAGVGTKPTRGLEPRTRSSPWIGMGASVSVRSRPDWVLSARRDCAGLGSGAISPAAGQADHPGRPAAVRGGPDARPRPSSRSDPFAGTHSPRESGTAQD